MVYLTSDLHGKLASLQKLLEKARFFDDVQNELYILGDVIDRNEQGGVDALRMIARTPNVELLLGNHERMMLDCAWYFEYDGQSLLHSTMLKDLARWKRNGAGVTIDAMKQLSREEREGLLRYVEGCPLYKTVFVHDRKYVLVHGGLGNFAPGKDLDDYTPDELLWERPNFDTTYEPKSYTVVFGHTPTQFYGPQYKGRMIRTDSWWNIDTGGATTDGHPMLICLDTGEEFYIDG